MLKIILIFIISLAPNFVLGKSLDEEQELKYEACVFSKIGEAKTDAAFHFVRSTCRKKFPLTYKEEWRPTPLPHGIVKIPTEARQFQIKIPIEKVWAKDGNLIVNIDQKNSIGYFDIWAFKVGEHRKTKECSGYELKGLKEWYRNPRYFKDTPSLMENLNLQQNRYFSGAPRILRVDFMGGAEFALNEDYCFVLFFHTWAMPERD